MGGQKTRATARRTKKHNRLNLIGIISLGKFSYLDQESF